MGSAIARNNKPSHHKLESAKFTEKNPHVQRNHFQKRRKGQILKTLAHKLKKLELNITNFKLKHAKLRLDCAKEPDPNVSYGLKAKN